MIRALMLSLACVACGNPALRCEEGPDGGAYVPFNGSCAPAPKSIAIDGVFDDWTEIPSDYPGCSGCSSGEVFEVHATMTSDGRFAIYAPTGGAPITNATHSYLISLTPLEQPNYTTTIRIGSNISETAFNNIVMTGLPFDVAFGATGFELAIPRSALPFGPGAAIDLVELQVLQGSWRIAQTFVPPITSVCWDASSSLCKPH